ncbi:DUF3140 domain-containing protein [Nocardiopsis exhalans]|uniref:DUF3140 domain-containing protein n=1 Tax=Nocardiopsis exhalans TaxID=163604 RepID=A0ABY5DEN8_9ACTN|nr:DUF3140 domain-containing protein [Nocardiopsis exhalans]USY22816.1 DUF3140 domain-containing protein [Nocardiopsis exhalans]
MAVSDPNTDRIWEEFHTSVNMTGEELRRWLLTDASGEDALPASGGVDAEGEQIVRLLNKRRTDVTSSDLELMERVSGFVREQLSDPRPEDDAWRRRLMRVGHDPLGPGSEPIDL